MHNPMEYSVGTAAQKKPNGNEGAMLTIIIKFSCNTIICHKRNLEQSVSISRQ